MPIATTGTASNGLAPGSDRGAEPAALLSPDYMARKSERPTDQHFASLHREFSAALREVMGPGLPLSEVDAVEGEAEEIEIETIFRRKLAGVRQLPRSERPHARKAARDWRTQALKDLREKRARDRYASHTRRQLGQPMPN